ncbi:MAG: HIT domain-containing protein [Anaerolineae bacterium]|nr:HIT domain-containing protein [Anaerolineae bacterium]
MKYLWSPWRMKYIQAHKNEEGCVFCTIQKMPDNKENLIVVRGELSYVVMNRYPYTSGHILVIPYIHKPNLEVLNADTRAEMMELVTQSMRVLRSIYRPQGFNMGANIGEAAGAGIAPHVHLHVVPRWSGDTNFMSSLGETRVLPEALEETYQRIKEAWGKD